MGRVILPANAPAVECLVAAVLSKNRNRLTNCIF